MHHLIGRIWKIHHRIKGREIPKTGPHKAVDRCVLNLRINEEIRVPEVRVVDEDGAMLGVMATREAIELAYEREKDLVEIAQQANPPVCKIIDYGKFAYEQQKREKLAKKAQHHAQLKEVRFKWRTDTHDFDFKTRHAREFLGEGHKVKATVMFKGREIMHHHSFFFTISGVNNA